MSNWFLHWGEEYQTEPTEEQKDLANYLNELGAEVVIGSHPHVIEPGQKLLKEETRYTCVLFIRKLYKCTGYGFNNGWWNGKLYIEL